jgi:D-alanyl-D-alanine-carboxypeptidase/D-alanyl-D-alanine-endopeptidase
VALVEGVLEPDGRQAFRGRSANEHSLFEIGSITKAFTGVLLAEMAVRGEVGLNDPLSHHLAGPRPAWRHREPTLAEIATHRSGLPNVPRGLARGELVYAAGLSGADPWARVSAADYRAMVASASPKRPPGARVAYSSMAVGLLGDALAARAGLPYEELLRQRVLEPLGLHSTAIDVPEAARDRLLEGRSRRGRPRAPIADFMPAAGSLRSDASDLLRFVGACLKPPDGPLGEALLLAQQPRARLGRNAAIGLCWILTRRRRGPRVVWHNGGTWGFRSFAAFVPAEGRAVVVLSSVARSVDRRGYRLAAP